MVQGGRQEFRSDQRLSPLPARIRPETHVLKYLLIERDTAPAEPRQFSLFIPAATTLPFSFHSSSSGGRSE